MSDTYENSGFYIIYQIFEALAAEAESIEDLNDAYEYIKQLWMNQRSKLVYIEVDGHSCLNVQACIFETRMFNDLDNALAKHKWRLMI